MVGSVCPMQARERGPREEVFKRTQVACKHMQRCKCGMQAWLGCEPSRRLCCCRLRVGCLQESDGERAVSGD